MLTAEEINNSFAQEIGFVQIDQNLTFNVPLCLHRQKVQVAFKIFVNTDNKKIISDNGAILANLGKYVDLSKTGNIVKLRKIAKCFNLYFSDDGQIMSVLPDLPAEDLPKISLFIGQLTVVDNMDRIDVANLTPKYPHRKLTDKLNVVQGGANPENNLLKLQSWLSQYFFQAKCDHGPMLIETSVFFDEGFNFVLNEYQDGFIIQTDENFYDTLQWAYDDADQMYQYFETLVKPFGFLYDDGSVFRIENGTSDVVYTSTSLVQALLLCILLGEI